MRNTLILFFGLFLSLTLFADCGGGNGIYIFPNKPTIRPNSLLLIETTNAYKNILNGSIYLKSGNKKVKLLVLEVLINQAYKMQVVLRPEKFLKAGLEYTLYIDSLPKGEKLDRYIEKTNQHVPVSYKVVKEFDYEKPIVLRRPKEISKVLISLACGDLSEVTFDFPVMDSSEVLIKATVKSIQTDKQFTFYLHPIHESIKVGHEMCGGAFYFDSSVDYEVEFSFLDLSGNLTAWTGDRIKFTKPTETER